MLEQGLFGGYWSLVDELEGDLVLHDLFDHDFQVSLAVSGDERTSPFKELLKATPEGFVSTSDTVRFF